MSRALLALVLCLAASGDTRVATLVAALGNAQDQKARNEAYLTLLREKPPEAPALLVAALPRFDTQGQEYGLWVLQSYPIEASQPALRKLLLEREPLLECGAAAALQRAGQRDVLEHIVRPLTRADLSPEQRRALVRRVYNMREPRIHAALRAWLVPEMDSGVLEDVLHELLLGEDPEAAAKVHELASSNGLAESARLACAAFLLTRGEETQAAVLVSALAADVGASFARLQRFLALAPHLPPELLAVVAKIAASSAVPGQAQLAIGILAQHATAKEVPLLEGLVGNPSALVAKAALEALQKRGVPVDHELLKRMLASTEPQRALAAADALRRDDDGSGFERVLELARAPGTDKAEAVRVLARFRRQPSVPPLLDALEDADALVRMAAEQGLSALLPSLFPYRQFDLATSGYAAQGAPEARSAGVAKIRAWWLAHARK